MTKAMKLAKNGKSSASAKKKGSQKGGLKKVRKALKKMPSTKGGRRAAAKVMPMRRMQRCQNIAICGSSSSDSCGVRSDVC